MQSVGGARSTTRTADDVDVTTGESEKGDDLDDENENGQDGGHYEAARRIGLIQQRIQVSFSASESR